MGDKTKVGQAQPRLVKLFYVRLLAHFPSIEYSQLISAVYFDVS
jgi:hypothetical protein